MSDDDYYGELDDFEESLWDADPAPDLADDLAEHTAYSPVWQDDPVGELDAYHSDWDYYSDDYYDDDPALKNSTLDGSSPKSQPAVKHGIYKRSRKRKLDEVRESTPVTGKGSLADSIKGTVWAQDDRERVVIYHKDQHKKVALLRNWRAMFKSDSGESHTFGRGQLQRDESWANNLSLEEMGLLPENGMVMPQEQAILEDKTDDEELPDVDGEISEEDEMMNQPTPGRFEHQDRRDTIIRGAGTELYDSSEREATHEEEPLPKRRRKGSTLQSPLRPRDSKNRSSHGAFEDYLNQEQGMQATAEASMPEPSVNHVPKQQLEVLTKTSEPKHQGNLFPKKRKLSNSQEEGNELPPDVAGRTKRMNSRKPVEDPQLNEKLIAQKSQKMTRRKN